MRRQHQRQRRPVRRGHPTGVPMPTEGMLSPLSFWKDTEPSFNRKDTTSVTSQRVLFTTPVTWTDPPGRFLKVERRRKVAPHRYVPVLTLYLDCEDGPPQEMQRTARLTVLLIC
jgi:hypothetical protein